jgi:hypothetical protein
MTGLLDGIDYTANQASYDLARAAGQRADHPHPSQEPLPAHRRRAAVRHLLHQTARPTTTPVACRRPAPRPATTTKRVAHHQHSRTALHRRRQTAAQRCLKTQDKSQCSSDQGSLGFDEPPRARRVTHVTAGVWVDGHAASSGMQTRNDVPSPVRLEIVIVPPSASTRSIRPVSPDPLPTAAPPIPSS